MSRTIVLVACVGMKQLAVAPARDLYTSPWFRKARAIAERADAWYILSAAHGVLHPDTPTAPYDATLNRMTAAARREWSAHVRRRLDTLLTRGDRVTIFAGERYRDGLETHLRRRGVHPNVPMRGLGIGQQLAWLTRNHP